MDEVRQWAIRAAQAAADKKANDVVIIDVADLLVVTDYFVICTGESTRQIKAISDAISETLKKEGIRPSHEEGTPESGWILLDYGEVIVHVFGSFERDYYQLDSLWEKACTKVRMP